MKICKYFKIKYTIDINSYNATQQNFMLNSNYCQGRIQDLSEGGGAISEQKNPYLRTRRMPLLYAESISAWSNQGSVMCLFSILLNRRYQ